MRTPLIKQIEQVSTNRINLKMMVFVLGFFFLGSVQNQLNAQIDCNITMACNDNVQVSLDNNCEATIAPDMILENPDYADSEYTVTIKDNNGNVIPNATVNGSHVGQTLQVIVTLNACNLTCWGTIKIEDKLPPVITNCPEVFLSCSESTTPGSSVPRPTAFDACTQVVFAYSDAITNLPCSSPYTRMIVRSWIVTDNYGNYTTCDQNIFIQRASLTDVVFPQNYDDIEAPAFRCDANLPLLPNGAPSPTVTGFPSNIDCPNLMFYYTDITFELCGAGFKVLRTWNVLDWCTGQERTDMQIIKIIDDVKPLCTSTPDFFNNVPTDEHECTATFLVPPPTVIFECSDWTYKVGYKLRDENGVPFENPIYDNITGNANIGYTISGLPQDTSWIVYTITDACGNFSECFTEVFVSDQEAPSAVCEGYTVISLDDIGWADLFAESIDDHSTDNCEIDRFEVKRTTVSCGNVEDLEFGPSVNFCCEDVSSDPNVYVKVIMRVYDKSDNYNDCLVNVKVQDKMVPTISCPANVTLDCGQDYKDLNLTGGYATGSDNCNLNITFSDSGSLNNCGQGTIFRNWRATDSQGLVATCTQRIEIRDKTPFNENNITWPGDKIVNGCSVADALPDAINSYPTYYNAECADIALSYDDLVVNNYPDVCIKILRTWKVADWCNFNPQSNDYFTYVQKIEVHNTTKPVITSSCNNITIETPDGSCESNVNLIVTATDDCTASSSLKYSWTVDTKDDGSVEHTGNSNQVNGTYSSGKHRVTFTVTDACGNFSTCSYLFTVVDNKPPTPICLGEVVWVLDEDGKAEVWASDFNLKSEDTCDEDSELRFAFNEAGNQTALSFDCSDIENGISQEIPLKMYVFDTDNNFEFCEVLLILQDSESTNACDDVVNSGRIGGTLLTPNNTPLQNVEVTLMNMDSEVPTVNMTNESGQYEFNDVALYQTYEIDPLLDVNPLNGVSTLDIVLIQRHILGLDIFTSPYSILAADVNKSKSVSASDLVELRKLILGITAKYAQNTSWMFVPANNELIDPSYPFDMDNYYIINEFLADNMNMDFVAIKVGDVNESAVVDFKTTTNEENRSVQLNLNLDNAIVRKGETNFVPVYAGFEGEIMGMQFTLSSDFRIDIKDIKSGRFNITESNLHLINDDRVAVSIDLPLGEQVHEGDVLFYVELQSKEDSDLTNITINSEITNAEVYTADFETQKLGLNIISNNNAEIVQYESGLLQNIPNPFSISTNVGFNLEKDSKVAFSLMDLSGKVIFETNNYFTKGSHTLEVTKDQLNNVPGVYYLQMKTNQLTSTIKMIMIE